MNETSDAYRVVSIREIRSTRNRLLLCGFCLGIAAGILGMLSVGPSCAVSPPSTVSSTLIDVGEHLCRDHEGLADIARISEDRYAFSCRELAQFPNVQVRVDN